MDKLTLWLLELLKEPLKLRTGMWWHFVLQALLSNKTAAILLQSAVTLNRWKLLQSTACDGPMLCFTIPGLTFPMCFASRFRLIVSLCWISAPWTICVRTRRQRCQDCQSQQPLCQRDVTPGTWPTASSTMSSHPRLLWVRVQPNYKVFCNICLNKQHSFCNNCFV